MFARKSALGSVLRIIRLPRAALGTAAALMLCDTVAVLLTPTIIGLISARILDSTQQETTFTLEMLTLFWALIIVSQATLRYFSTKKIGESASIIGTHLRLRTYEHTQALPLSFFHQKEHGDILSLLSEDVRRISQFITRYAIELLPHILTLIGASVIVFSIDPLAGIAALCIIPFSLLSIKLLGRAARPLSKQLAQQQANHTILTEENLRTIELIKAFTREDKEKERYSESNQEVLNAEIALNKINAKMAPTVQAITGLSIAGFLWLGSTRVASGALTADQLISTILYGLILFRPLHALATLYGGYRSAQGAAERVKNLLAIAAEPTSGRNSPIPHLRREIVFEDLGFSYAGKSPVFTHFSATIKAGKTTVISGKNGAGKTTLLRLLIRFLEPATGRILVDGIDIREYSIHHIRRHTSYVSQNVALVSGSIEDNVFYGLEDKHRLKNSSGIKPILDLLSDSFSDALKTQVGPQGNWLSGGQKQLVSLARAWIKNAEILILDEPSSMLDETNGKQAITLTLSQFAHKTVIIVTHDNSILPPGFNTLSL